MATSGGTSASVKLATGMHKKQSESCKWKENAGQRKKKSTQEKEKDIKKVTLRSISLVNLQGSLNTTFSTRKGRKQPLRRLP